MSLPCLVTTDPDLLDFVLKLAAAAGTEIHVAQQPEPESWRLAPLILIGEDSVALASERALPRRSDVIVVGHRDPFDELSEIPTTVWRDAVALGASHVIRLPDAERWLIDHLAEIHDGLVAGGPVVTVFGATGGAGATTLARALAASIVGSLLVDLDPFPSGATGLDDGGVGAGLQWPDLAKTSGRIPPTTLKDALPRLGQGRVLTGLTPEVGAGAVSGVLEAGARGFPLTVVDAPRSRDGVTEEAWNRSDAVVVVVGPDEHRAYRAEGVVHAVREWGRRPFVVPRLGPGALNAWHLELPHLFAVPIAPPMRHDRALARGELLPTKAPRALRASIAAVLESVGVRAVAMPTSASHRRRSA